MLAVSSAGSVFLVARVFACSAATEPMSRLPARTSAHHVTVGSLEQGELESGPLTAVQEVSSWNLSPESDASPGWIISCLVCCWVSVCWRSVAIQRFSDSGIQGFRDSGINLAQLVKVFTFCSSRLLALKKTDKCKSLASTSSLK